MQPLALIESRSPQWRRLETLCDELETRRSARKLPVTHRVEFASLYRAACADLALADAYQLPSDSVRYLHQLVGRAHNQLYRTDELGAVGWKEELFERIPRRLYGDNSLRLASLLFWGGFIAAMFLSSKWTPVPEFADAVVGQEALEKYEAMYEESFSSSTYSPEDRIFMAGYYIYHNASIGLRCFVMGLAFGIGGMFAIVFNAVIIGATFGYLSTTDSSQNFFEFVTAHGPFELTAIVLSGAAGMKLGFALVDTGGLSRSESLMSAARQTMPTMFAAVLLFMFAAVIEGFISPSPLPYGIKAAVAMASSLVLMWYLVILGYAQQPDEEEDERLAVE